VTARLALLAVAVLAVIAFALAVRQETAEQEAYRLLFRAPPSTPDRIERAARERDRAAPLNPGTRVAQLRAPLAAFEGDPERARRLLQDVVRREPDNIEAWASLAFALGGRPAAQRRAQAQVRRLSPPVPAP
jgi:hypothetical protein